MTAATSFSCIEQIGTAAGLVWHKLAAEGPVSFAKLVKSIDGVPRDVVLQAIGWLAREGKIDIEESKRTRIVSLR